MSTVASFADLKGKTIIAIDGAVKGSERITITCADLKRFVLSHYQSCCESVLVEDVTGDPADLVGHVVMLAEESTKKDGDPPSEYSDSFTWTFYKLRTHGGDVTIRWLGESNGYYGEEVNVDVNDVKLTDLTPEQQVRRDMVLERGGL
jgi:hypothetical protein